VHGIGRDAGGGKERREEGMDALGGRRGKEKGCCLMGGERMSFITTTHTQMLHAHK
jgi:hypothetical protein